MKTKNSKLDIIVTLASEESTYVINGNDNLEDGSIISIVVTDKDDNHNIYKIYIEKIHEINREYRNVDRVTDVISFALEDSIEGYKEEIRMLGDIYIYV